MSTHWTSSYSRSESPSVARSITAATASRSDIHDDDTLSASIIDTSQTGSPLAEAEIEAETYLFLKTVSKSLWGLLCVLDCGNLTFILNNIAVNWEVQF